MLLHPSKTRILPRNCPLFDLIRSTFHPALSTLPSFSLPHRSLHFPISLNLQSDRDSRRRLRRPRLPIPTRRQMMLRLREDR